MAKVRVRAAALDGTAVAVTFHPHPVRILNPAEGPPLLTVKPRKEELIAEQGMDLLLNIQFTRHFASLSAADFIAKILLRKIGLRELVIGYDQSFGSGREGGVDFILQTGRELGFPVHLVGPVLVEGLTVSSTRARQIIQAGQVDEVRAILGRPYQISGRVIHGHDRGERLLGFPTANLKSTNEVLPGGGVYAVRVILEGGKLLQGVTNVGTNPTFGDEELSVETFILDFDQDLYGRRIRVDFIARLRDERKFASLDDLTGQIKKDVALARKVLAQEG